VTVWTEKLATLGLMMFTGPGSIQRVVGGQNYGGSSSVSDALDTSELAADFPGCLVTVPLQLRICKSTELYK
jgi:hypothetical protein